MQKRKSCTFDILSGIVARRWLPALAAVPFLLMSGLPAAAAIVDPLNDAFTSVNFQSDFHLDKSTFGDANPNTSTQGTFDDASNTSFTNLGLYHGEADAGFGTLGALVEISGAGASSGFTIAFNQEFRTITDPNFANGTPGTVQLGYNLSATSLVVPVGPNPVDNTEFTTVRLHVQAGPAVTELVTVIFYQDNIGGGGVVQTPSSAPGLLSDPIPFIYGEEFATRTSLTALATIDTEFVRTTFGPLFEEWKLGTVESVRINALNTSELATIIINGEDSPDALVVSRSGTNYNPFIAGNPGTPGGTPVSVPEPSTLALFVIGLAGLGFAARRRR